MLTDCLRVLLLVSHLLLAGGVAAAEEPTEPPPLPEFPSLPADAAAGTGILQPCLEAYAEGVRCGRYRVWEDRAARSGRTLDLAFVVADALDPDAPASDAVTLFFGGPGVAVTDYAGPLIEHQADFRRRRDLLLLDFRGVGASGSLDCDVPYPGGVASRFGVLFPLDHVVACRDHLKERARLDLYTSEHTMDDLDELRAWLNYSALDLVGGSYGTREIQVFLRRHPERARVAVMSGVVPIFDEGYVRDARELQVALDELVTECAGDAACAEAFPDLAATVEQVFERVRRDPPTVDAEGQEVRLGPGELGYALRGLLYQRGAEVPLFLHRAASGDWQPVADYYLERSAWVAEVGGMGNAGMHFSVVCAEDIARLDDETVARETAGTLFGDHLIGAYRGVCALWPHADLPASFWDPVESDVPVLLLSGRRDPVTPPANADAVARYLPNSLHLVIPGAGHVFGGECLDSIQRQFIEAGTLDGLDTSCIQSRPREEFVLPLAAAKAGGISSPAQLQLPQRRPGEAGVSPDVAEIHGGDEERRGAHEVEREEQVAEEEQQKRGDQRRPHAAHPSAGEVAGGLE